MYRYALALRWLWSRPINVLGIAGVMVSVWALIVVVSIFSGYLREVRHHIRSTTSDLSVLRLPRDVPYRELEATILRDANVRACSPRIVHYGLLHGAGSSAKRPSGKRRLPGPASPFVTLLGIDPQREALVSSFATWLQRAPNEIRVADLSAPLRAAAGELPPTILLSEARMAGRNPGSAVGITTGELKRTGPNDPQQQLQLGRRHAFAIAGAFSTEHASFDDSNCFVHIDALRGMLELPAGSATEIAVQLHDDSARDTTALRLETELNAALPPRYASMLVRSWDQQHQQMLSAVDHQRSLMKLVLFVIMVVAAFLMYATLSMMVTEKNYDIGILTAMGGTRLGVMQVFLSCGLAIALIGTGLGVVVGCVSAVYLDDVNQFLKANFDIDLFPTEIYNLKHVPYELDPLWIAQVAVMALIVGALVSALPAWRAARYDPVESLRVA